MPHPTHLLAALLPCAGAAAQAVAPPAAPPPLTLTLTTLTLTTPAPPPEPAAPNAIDDRDEPAEPESSWQAFRHAHGDYMDQRERHQPMAQLRFQYLPHAGLANRPGSFDLYHWNADLDVPLAVSADTYVDVGGMFEMRDYQVDGLGGFADDKLYAAAARLGFATFLGDDLLLEAQIEPGFWSDWKGALTQDAFDIPTKILATDRVASDCFLKFGVRYNEVYPQHTVLPYLGVAWLPSDTVRVDVLAPETVEVSVWPRPDVGLLLGGEVQGAEYLARAPNGRHSDLRVQEDFVYTGAVVRSNQTTFATRVGAIVAGDYRLDDNPVPAQHVDGRLRASFFVELSFGIDF
jgi:hypothetical protein